MLLKSLRKSLNSATMLSAVVNSSELQNYMDDDDHSAAKGGSTAECDGQNSPHAIDTSSMSAHHIIPCSDAPGKAS